MGCGARGWSAGAAATLATLGGLRLEKLRGGPDGAPGRMYLAALGAALLWPLLLALALLTALGRLALLGGSG